MQPFKNLLPFLVISTVVCIIFLPYLMGYVGITPNVGTNDNVDLQVPFRQVLQENLKQRTLPLWEQRISAGFPLFAEGQIGALYPLNIFFALLPVPAYYSLSLSIIAAIILSGINMYLFLIEFLTGKTEHKINKIRLFAMCGAIIWSQTGVHYNHTAHLNVLNIFSWLPWQLWIIERMLNGKDSRIKSIALLSLPVGLQILAGHPQITSYCLMFIALYWLLNQLLVKSESRLKEFILNGVTVGFALLLGLLLGAVQLFPTLEFTVNSTRQAGLDEEAINFLSLRIQDLPTFISPFYNFTYEPRSLAQLGQVGWPFDERYSYIGIIPLILALASIPFIFKKRQSLILFFLCVFFLLLSLGNQSPIGILLKFPPLNLFRIPVKFTPLAQMVFAILATVSLKELSDRIFVKKSNQYPFKKVALTLGIIIIISSLDTGTKLYKLYPIQKGEWWFEKPDTVRIYEDQVKKSQINKLNKPLEMRVLGQDYNVQMHKQYLEQNPALWDNMQPQLFKNNRAILPAFDMLTYDVPLLDNAINSAGLKVKWYSEIEGKLFFTPATKIGDNQVNYPDHYWKFVRLVGTRYFFHNNNLLSENTIIIGKTNFSTGQDQVGVYQIKNPLPFMQTPLNIKYVEDKNTFQAINDENFSPETDIIVSDNHREQIIHSTNNIPENISYTAITPQLISAKVQSTGPAVVLIRQSYYPGWTATVNKNKTEVLRVSHAFQGLSIPGKGAYDVQLEYKPSSFLVGTYVSLAAVGLYLCLMLADVFMQRGGHQLQKKVEQVPV
ncbi:MAG: YfhO family protein [bacterium]|nr:YfhO family protein [bacterium]